MATPPTVPDPAIPVTPDLRHRVEEIFEAALDLPPSRRSVFVASAVDGDEGLEAEVLSLLVAHDRAGGALEREIPRARFAFPPRDEHIGPYRVVGELGRGGMGVVYAAERDDGQFRRRVAIKVLRADADPSLEARVVAERQILASLDHPNIARLLDGGLTDDGRPFLVMEHVDGLPIDVYADRMRLTIDERLRLFNTVARAVQHAHATLVVHRDLKPSNILVTSRGEVKLLDFGIAKLLNPSMGPGADTLTEARALTPDFASPEQVRGEAFSTASDVYSLGVVLYRLLCGVHPYDLADGSMQTIVRVVGTTDPPRPSEAARGEDAAERAAARRTTPERLARRLRGDLDAIALKTLRKEPLGRYGSPELLAQDLERHLEGKPVRARKGSRGYRVRKLLRRHRYEVAAVVLVALSLVGGAGGAVWQAREAGLARDRAHEALRQSEEVTAFLMELFRVSDPEDTRLDRVTADDLLRRGLQRVESLSSQPLVQARMLGVIGELHMQLGQYDPAILLLRRSLDGRTAELGARSPETAEAMVALGLGLRRRAAYDEARALFREALEIQREALGPDEPAVAATLLHLAYIEFDLHRRGELLRDALAIQVDALGPDHHDVLETLMILANNARGLGEYGEAEAMLRRVLDTRVRTLGPADPLTALPMLHLGDILYEFGDRPDEAETFFRRALEIQRASLGEDDLSQVHGLHSLGALLARQGRFDEAEPLLRRAYTLLAAALGTRHPRASESRLHLAGALVRQGRFEEAEAEDRAVIEGWTRSLGPGHPSLATARIALVGALEGQGRLDEALREALAALDIRREALGERSLMVGLTMMTVGDVVRRMGQTDRARRTYVEGRSILLEHLPPDHPQVRDMELRIAALAAGVPGPRTGGPGSR